MGDGREPGRRPSPGPGEETVLRLSTHPACWFSPDGHGLTDPA
ncbi:hypothetical protein [Actinomadura bangladeshensis]|nr:hypothetical protein [Actinomadura bangladeshensis]